MTFTWGKYDIYLRDDGINLGKCKIYAKKDDIFLGEDNFYLGEDGIEGVDPFGKVPLGHGDDVGSIRGELVAKEPGQNNN